MKAESISEYNQRKKTSAFGGLSLNLEKEGDTVDPLLFALNADVVGEALGAIVVLSLIIERALAPIFEWRPVLNRIKEKGIKEPVAIIVSVAAVVYVEFDALAVIFSREANDWIGYLITGLVVAGGSKGSIKLFRDYLGWKSVAQQEHEEERDKAKKKDNGKDKN